MMRPGHATAKYDDVRGEAAGDIGDNLGSYSLDKAACELGLKTSGYVVCITIRGGNEEAHPELVDVTFQVSDEGYGAEDLNQRLANTGGILAVTEHYLRGVPIVDVLRCFKRLEVGLFLKSVKAGGVSVSDRISIAEADEQ